ncbi:hypothetical protein FBU59_005139 [Linderina macrospora]|uniref:Uncharacterized protein n=1 Tax=Linderina macrospora TaxID=4868 RepID=A0ACC1J3E8_9FUNG|nr:hypothetical protein FBU59_005139 [Linderina macrospora]
MSAYLKSELSKHGIDDEAIIEYCVGLLDDETMETDEKQEAIAGYLEAVTEQDLSDLISTALTKTTIAQQEAELAAQAAAQQKLNRALELEKAELEKDAQEARDPVATRQLTMEERRQREKLLMTYGFDVPEIVENANGEAEIVYREATAGTDMGVERNLNAQIVADKERAVRETSRAAHLKKVEREKELLEKDRLRKEKEKRRTAKKEKRRM